MTHYLISILAVLVASNSASLGQSTTNTNSSLLITNVADIFPYVERFSKEFDLDLPEPLSTNQVARFFPERSGAVAPAVWLTNRMVFGFYPSNHFAMNYFDNAHSISELSREQMKALRNAPTITKKQALGIARKYLARLGYSESDSPVLPPRVTQEQWQLMGEEKSDPLPFFTVEWPWKYAPDREYFTIEVDGIRLKINHFFTLHGSPAEESVKSCERIK